MVKFVIKELKLNKPILVGYDNGAAIGLKMGIVNSSTFDKIIAFHASYTEEEKDELKKLTTPTLILWCKQD